MRKRRKKVDILWDRCWKLMSNLVRKEENFICFTCGVKGDKYNMHAGHFQHSSQDFIRENVHCQCIRCNHFLSGNLAVYTVKMIEQYGIEKVKELIRNKHIPHRYTVKELNEVLLWLTQTKQ